MSCSKLVLGPTFGEEMSDEVHRLCIPIQPSPWKEALQDTEPEDYRSFLPDPRMFSAVQTLSRLQKYVAAWLTVRETWIRKVETLTEPPGCCQTKRLKHFFMGYFRSSDDGDLDNPTNVATDRRAVQEFLGLDAIKMIDPANYSGEWRGEPLSGPIPNCITFTIIREVVWELSELGFQKDLHLLEDRFSAKDYVGYAKTRAGRCFPGGWKWPRGAIDRTNMGLSSPSWQNRAQWTLELARILVAWPKPPPPLPCITFEDITTAIPSSGQSMMAIERKVALVYCFHMERALRRAPIVPVVL